MLEVNMEDKEQEIMNQLEKTGTAEISNGIVTQVTQAIDEQPNKVKMLVLGEMVESGIRPISEVCPCSFYSSRRFKTKENCQAFQKKEGEARGFTQVICPEQFKD
jgi:hypothetical protein